MSDNQRQNGDADQRKARTEAYLEQHSIPINPTLPFVESETEVTIQDPDAIARRAVVLLGVIAVGHGLPPEEVVAWLKAEDLWDVVSPLEADFLQSNGPPRQAVVNATWRAEALWVLLWSLRKVDDLEFPTKLCDMERLQLCLPRVGAPTAAFINSADRRSTPEILDAVDLIYRTHWAIRDAQIKGKPIPAGLKVGVVVERHYALNWLVLYDDEWDEITTDT